MKVEFVPPAPDNYQLLAEAIMVRAFKDYANAMYKLEGIEKPEKDRSMAYYEKVKKDCLKYFNSDLYANTSSLDYKPILEKWRDIER